MIELPKLILFMLLSMFLMTGCARRFAREALELGQPIFEDYRTYVQEDASLTEERRQIRLEHMNQYEGYLKDVAAK